MIRPLFLLIVCFLVVGCTLSHPLVGRWKTTDDKGTDSLLFFKADGTFEAITKGENLPGTWVLHEDTNPNQLELIFEEDRKVVTIAKVNGDQLMIEPRASEDEKMPTQFSDKVQKYVRQ